MFEAKYSKFLTVLLVVIIIAVIGLGGVLGYNYYKKYSTDKDSEQFVSTFTEDIGETDTNVNTEGEGGSIAENITERVITLEEYLGKLPKNKENVLNNNFILLLVIIICLLFWV